MAQLFFRFGCMNAGKSMFLLATAHSFSERGIPFLLLKSSIDNRDGKDVICSRALGSRPCVSVEPDTDIFSLVETLIHVSVNMAPPKWILVDESQFLTPEQVDELGAVVDVLGINVICYGLRTDFKTKLFPGSQRLFEIADKIEEIKTTCSCDRKTIFNARVDSNGKPVVDGEQVEVGGNDRYVALCRNCYYKRIGNGRYQDFEDNCEE